MPTIASCIHRITHHTTDGRHGSKDVVLIMPLSWTASSGVKRQPEVQSKVVILSAQPATTAEAAVQAEHRLNLTRQYGKMDMRIDRHYLATSDPLASMQRLQSVDTCIRIAGTDITPVDSVRDRDVYLDSRLDMRAHIGKIVSVCFFHL